MQQTRQFLDEARKLLGEKFIVISCEDSIKYKTSEKDGIKIMVSLQDDNSVVFLDLIQVKIRNTTPSIPSNEMANIKGKQVKFKNLKMGIFNSQFTFSAEDVYIIKKEGDTKWLIKLDLRQLATTAKV